MLALVAATAGIWVATIAATVGASVVLVRLLDVIDRGSGPDEPSGGGGGGGGGVEPRPRPGGGEPGWWPEFEREFERYVTTGAGHAVARASEPTPRSAATIPSGRSST